jgi:diguanylate cyclase (GGDEF)-like protein
MVWFSVAVAIAVSYTALTLAGRISRTSACRTCWLLAGAAVMGLGMWSMHFIGMMAVRLPLRLTYNIGITMGSLGIAVATSGFALAIISRRGLTWNAHWLAAIVMGTGIAGMHYTGMASIRIVPTITYETTLLIAFVGLAIGASFVALWLAFRLRPGHSIKAVLPRCAGAVVLGAAISGMHYLGMSAAHFSENSYSLSGTRLDNPWLAVALGVFALGTMALLLLTIFHDALLKHRLRDRDRALEQADARARHAATHDPLTGLPNRASLAEAAEVAIAEVAAVQGQLALMVLNLDRIKSINDSLGHQAGDELLLELSRRLRGVLRRRDTMARLSGDEFTLLTVDLQSASDAEAIGAKFLDAVQQPFLLQGQYVHAALSIGISMYPQDGTTFEALLRNANAAMRHAKQAARGGFLLYSPNMNPLNDDRLMLENELRRALELNQLELHYQPKVDIANNRVRSAEALIRWRHPTRGLVPPNSFIPLAEETGLIVQIGEWVLREACRQMRVWLDAGMSPVRVAVNLSARQFRHAHLTALVSSALDDAQLEPGFLELELTESAVMHDAEQSAATLQTLSAMGVHISIDDFGTGYSSLSYLRRFPLDKLKIDRSFIRDLMTSQDDMAIVRAIVSLAHSLRLRVVAEGVETAEQLDFLRGLGCDQYQGFFCSPAVPADKFVALLQHLRAELPDYAEADMLRTQSRLSAYSPAR